MILEMDNYAKQDPQILKNENETNSENIFQKLGLSLDEKDIEIFHLPL